MMTALRSGDPEALGEALINDLQEPALSLRPGLRAVLDAGMEFGALGGIVSGSGPTVAFLTGSSEHAIDLCVALTASGVVEHVTRAKGPVHGAQVLSDRLATELLTHAWGSLSRSNASPSCTAWRTFWTP